MLQRDNYLCQVCKRAGRITPATTVHHIKAVRVDYGKRLDPNNLETICKACHNAEHNERAKSLHDKQEKIKSARRSDVFVFNANPET
ncbi:HNH endonuclease [Limosilactobacillus rudii]|uniref:HNH endonuclease signature motif containing protein n=1 Tax=Limosilactobacillus rudii TaxID=2759755 RepID=UPI001E650F8D|nr:HNH endonuclease signature motif containing protein [Limosilactobacillus rudii]MCD7134037.1 HNH endonuclease [Limosilactobacillus rudii]